MTREEFKSFFQKNKYKRSYFQYIGCGQFRTVYKFRYNNEFYVLKLARSKEDIHCDNEKWAYIETRNTRAADILCEVLTDYSDDMVTVMRYAKPFVQKYYGGDKDIIPQYKVNYIKYKYDFDNYRVPFNNIYDACCKTGTDFNDLAHNILTQCKSIERAMGRTGEPEFDGAGNRIYRSRVIDLDILLLGDVRIDDEDLKIPHPLMQERDFVMTPLQQILR